MTLTAVNRSSAQLTPQNHVGDVEAAWHKSKRDVELIVGPLRPRPDVP